MAMKSPAKLLLVLAFLAAAPLCAQAQSATPAPGSIELVGIKDHPALSLEALSALPQVEQEVTFKTSKGLSTARYKGPLLWDVLASTGALEGLDRNKELAKTLLVTAVDGYEIAFSIGELAPEFGNSTNLLVLETDGEKLRDGFRIVVQGDKRGARAVHNVARIELR